MKDWQGVYTITFKTTDTGNLGAATNTFPFILNKAASKLSLGAGANYKQVGTRTGTYAYNLNFADVMKEPICDPAEGTETNPLIRGRIGFGEWMKRAVTASIYPDPKHPDAEHPEQLLTRYAVLNEMPTIRLWSRSRSPHRHRVSRPKSITS